MITKLFFHHFVDLAEIRAVAQQLAETGEIRELIHRSSVDFPEPEEPTIQIISPASISISIFLKTS